VNKKIIGFFITMMFLLIIIFPSVNSIAKNDLTVKIYGGNNIQYKVINNDDNIAYIFINITIQCILSKNIFIKNGKGILSENGGAVSDSFILRGCCYPNNFGFFSFNILIDGYGEDNDIYENHKTFGLFISSEYNEIDIIFITIKK